MLAIKFKRVGKKHQASFRIIVIEKRSKINSRFTADLGWFNPRQDSFKISEEETNHWLKVGAQPTDSVYNLFVRAGILKGPKKAVHKKPKKKESATEKPKTQEKPKKEEKTTAVEIPVDKK